MLDTSNSQRYHYTTKHVHIDVLGGIKTSKLESMRVTLAVNKLKHKQIIRHSLDLYNDTQVEKFVRKCAERLEIGTSLVRQSLAGLTKELENYRFALLAEIEEATKPLVKQLTKKEREQAVAFLKKPDLLTRTDQHIGKSGVIGEDTNRLVMYLLFTSRKTVNPLHCISFGSSGVGKTHLQSKVAELIPEEDKVEITVLSANAFYYFNRTELRHKLILIEDMDGAESVLYPLRELQSKKRITKTVVHKDARGESKTIHLVVEGPVAIAGCTTRESVYEDNSNRSFLLYIDESQAQDDRIMHYQRAISAGQINTEEQHQSAELLRNVQRVLKPIKVINPFAQYLSLPKAVFKPRRTNIHYLQFIEVVTFYHQYQREEKFDSQTGEAYIETTIEDIQYANTLITTTLLHKSDLLNGASRLFFEQLKLHLQHQRQTSFTNGEVRRWMRLGKSTVRRRFMELLEVGLIRRTSSQDNKTYSYILHDTDEYKNLKTAIDTALQECITKISEQVDS